MVICQQCQTPWSWKTTVKETNKFMKPMVCPHCHELQFLTSASKQRTGIINLCIPPLVILPSHLLQLPLSGTIGLGLFALALIPFVYPRFVELTNEDQPLW